MQRMREVIRGSLARSLRTLTEEDRLAAALPVVCGTALAAHCEVAWLDETRTLHLRVDAPEWLRPLLGMRDRVQHDLQRVAGVPLTGLHFVEAGSRTDRFRQRSSDAPEPEDTGSAGSSASSRPRRFA